MGMDVYGKNPSSGKGEYFRNNVWWWHPLWDYCVEVAPVAKRVKNGHTNDGSGLGEHNSKILAKRLRKEIESGRCKEYADAYAARIAAIPMEDCDLCKGTGTRPGGEEQFGKQWVKDMKGCNGCLGKGKKKPWAANYPFSVDNVVEFCDFLETSGGFKIC